MSDLPSKAFRPVVLRPPNGVHREGLEVTLDGERVEVINSFLRAKRERPDPFVLKANEGKSFEGSIVLGMGFTLTSERRKELIRKDPRNAERIFPYIGGEEINTSPTQDFDRYVINFGDMSLAEAERWPDLLSIVRETVKPEREELRETVDCGRLKATWWLFCRTRPELQESIALLKRCLVTSRVTKHLCFAFQPTDRVFAETLYVFPLDDHARFAVLQSRVHEAWARLLSSSLMNDLRYAASDCFETFPFPPDDAPGPSSAVERAGEALYEARARYLAETGLGLTKAYNALKGPDNDDPGVARLRELHETMDRAVLDAYGWEDLEVPPYVPATEADRRALERFEGEIIDRLFLLNAERARLEREERDGPALEDVLRGL